MPRSVGADDGVLKEPWDERMNGDGIWVWVKIGYPNDWMVNTNIDKSTCGPGGL